MKQFLLAAIAVFGFATPAAADDYMGGYYATIGPQDFYNSSGVRLRDLCAIVQQDRANFHRFGKRDQGDESDPFFADRANRALIGQSCRYDTEWTYIRDEIMKGNITPVRIGVFGSGGRINYVFVGTTAG